MKGASAASVSTLVARLSPSAASGLITSAAALIWLQLALLEPRLGSVRLAHIPTTWRLTLLLAALAAAALVALAAYFRFAILTPCLALLGLYQPLAFWCAALVIATSAAPLLHPYVSRQAPRRLVAQLLFAASGWLGAQLLLLYAVNVAAFGAYIGILLPVPLLLVFGTWHVGRLRQRFDRTLPLSEGEAPWGARHSPFVAALLGAACFCTCAVLALSLFLAGGDFGVHRPDVDAPTGQDPATP